MPTAVGPRVCEASGRFRGLRDELHKSSGCESVYPLLGPEPTARNLRAYWLL